MIPLNSESNRRNFIKSTGAITAGFTAFACTAYSSEKPFTREAPWAVVGPREGFSPHVGTMFSMLSMMRHMILQPVKDLTVEQLDFLVDENANSIGAMLLHLAATETYYQLNTFENMQWGNWSDEVKKKWDIPMKLGADGRSHIKGNPLDYYINALEETRQKTIEGFKRRDDAWLMKIDPDWGWNNYGKWFHVAEHESNHNGQIKWIKGRLPGAKPGND